MIKFLLEKGKISELNQYFAQNNDIYMFLNVQLNNKNSDLFFEVLMKK